jgi:hypothetical protein
MWMFLCSVVIFFNSYFSSNRKEEAWGFVDNDGEEAWVPFEDVENNSSYYIRHDPLQVMLRLFAVCCYCCFCFVFFVSLHL